MALRRPDQEDKILVRRVTAKPGDELVCVCTATCACMTATCGFYRCKRTGCIKTVSATYDRTSFFLFSLSILSPLFFPFRCRSPLPGESRTTSKRTSTGWSVTTTKPTRIGVCGYSARVRKCALFSPDAFRTSPPPKPISLAYAVFFARRVSVHPFPPSPVPALHPKTPIYAHKPPYAQPSTHVLPFLPFPLKAIQTVAPLSQRSTCPSFPRARAAPNTPIHVLSPTRTPCAHHPIPSRPPHLPPLK